MAARRQRRADEDALDPVEAADVDVDEEEEVEDDALALDDDAFDDEDEDPEPDPEESLETAELPDELAADDDETEVAVLPVPVAFDDEDEETLVAAVAGDDDEEPGDEIDGLRDGEFVCRSCYMAKLETQLADAERLLCRDCA